MKRTLVGYAVICGIILGIALDIWIQAGSQPIVYVAEAKEVEPKEVLIEVEDVHHKIKRYAEEYGVDPEVMDTVVHCESRYNPRAVGDGGKSRGLVQIHADYHPHVTDDMAFDEDYALTFLAEKLQQGKGHLWTCYRMNY